MMASCGPKIEVGCGVAKGDSSFAAGSEAARKAVDGVRGFPISSVLVFTSVSYNLDEVLAGITSIVGDVPVLGTTTAGEICNEEHEKTVTVVALASPYLKVYYKIGRNVAGIWRDVVDEIVNSAELKPFFQYNSTARRKMIRRGKDIFAILFSPGNTRYNNSHSFEILEMLRQKSLGGFPIFGGSSADDWQMETNYILAGKTAYQDSMLLAIFVTELQFGIAMSHGFRPTSKTVMVTGVDEQEILTLDGLPAADVYCKTLGFSKEDLRGKHLTYSTGSTFGVVDAMDQYSIYTASYFTERDGIRLAHPVSNGSILTVMEPDPGAMVQAGARALRKAAARGRISEMALGLVSYCASRPKIMGEKSRDEVAEMRRILDGKPLVGFFSFGEQGVSDSGICQHANSSVSCLVLGNQLSQMAQVAFENDELLRRLKSKTTTLKKVNIKLRQEMLARERAREELNKANADLEMKVAERTLELSTVNRELTAMYTQLQAVNRELQSEVVVRELAEVEIAGKNHELEQAFNQLKNAQSQIIHQEKMASIGQLAAGVAHEINNPLGFVMSNFETLQKYVARLMAMVTAFKELHSLVLEENIPSLMTKAEELTAWGKRQKIDYIIHDIDPIFRESHSGLMRVGDIIKALRLFTRIDQQGSCEGYDINEGVRNSLIVSRNETKYVAQVEENLGKVPRIWVVGGQINQVLLNLILNAAFAIKTKGDKSGLIKIITYADEQYVYCMVVDNGSGIPEKVKNSIFNPFFTTKPVGQGTGLGLSISYDIIVNKHGGELAFESQEGVGTTFIIKLPIQAKNQKPK